jgi:hypothetical protein
MFDERNRTKEKWLREEIRATRSSFTGLLQWGVTILAALETNLYYVRRDVAKHLQEAQLVSPDQMFPFFKWVVGTFFIFSIAVIFSILIYYVIRRHIGYRSQLLAMDSYSGIVEPKTGGKINFIPFGLLFFFPVFDLVLWTYSKVGSVMINIPW